MSEVADKVKDLSLKDKKRNPPTHYTWILNQNSLKRIKLFDELKAQYDEEISKKEKLPIKITLRDGTIKEGTAYETSPMDIANSIGKSFAERQVIAKVDGKLWDMPSIRRRCQVGIFGL